MLLGVNDADVMTMRPALDQLPNLAILNLSSSCITDEGLAELRGLTGLRRLDLRDTKVTIDGIASLQRSLPHLVVEK